MPKENELQMSNKNKSDRKKWFAMDAAIVAVLLFIDQISKYFAIVHLKDQPAYVLWQGVFELRYLENRGTAFGLFLNQKTFILIACALFLIVIGVVLYKLPDSAKSVKYHVLLSFIIAGGVGNMIDRIRFDYVVDFLYFVLIDYPIFNIADSFIVVATILLFILVLREKDFDLNG